MVGCGDNTLASWRPGDALRPCPCPLAGLPTCHGEDQGGPTHHYQGRQGQSQPLHRRCSFGVFHSSWEGPAGTRGKELPAWVSHECVFVEFLVLSSSLGGVTTTVTEERSIHRA